MTSPMTRSYKELHDRLLAEKPDGAVHDPDSCPFCAMEDEPSGGGNMTDEELQAKIDAAVAEAVKAKDEEIASLKAAVVTTETEAAVKAAVADKDTEIAELRKELDEAVLREANAKAEHDSLVAFLEAEKTAAEEREAAAARKDSRIEKLRTVARFPEEYLTANADRFAAMSDDEFEARCAEYAALAPAGTTEVPAGMPGLRAGLEGPGSNGNGKSAAYKELFALRREGRGHVDLSSL